MGSAGEAAAEPTFGAAPADDGALWLGDADGNALARFVVRDALREDAAEAVARLQAQGIAVHIASGDAGDAVQEIADAAGIRHWQARQSPEDKLQLVQRLQDAGHRVAMVGDGINDAPVLAGADVSLAMAEGAAIAHRAADLVLMRGRLVDLADALALARRSRRVLRQNLAWALAYNVIALPFAMAGLVAPWQAALGMTASSLLVTVNALRLQRIGRTRQAVRPTSAAPAAAFDASRPLRTASTHGKPV